MLYPVIGFSREGFLNRFYLTSLEYRRSIDELIFLNELIHSKYYCSQLLVRLNFYVPNILIRQHKLFSLPIPYTTFQKYSPLYRIYYK